MDTAVPISKNALLAIQGYLRNHAYLTSLGDVKVAPNLNGYTGAEKWVVFTPAPGSTVTRNRIQVRTFTSNCYAPDYDTALKLCESTQAAVLSMRGSYGSGDSSIVVTATEVSVTPYDLTDQLNGRYRFVADTIVYYRNA